MGTYRRARRRVIRRKAGPHSAIPAKILDAATDLFFKDGYERITVDAVVAKAGGSKSNIYKHFGGKEGLLFAVVERESATLRKPLDEIDIKGLTLDVALHLIAKVFLSIIYAERTVALHRLVISQSRRYPGLSSMFIASGPDGSTAAVARLFKNWQNAGVLKTHRDPNILARQFLDLVKINEHSHLLLGMRPASRQAHEKTINEAIQTFLEGACS